MGSKQRPQPVIRVITTNPPKRYCTKRGPARLAIPPRYLAAPDYIAAFIELNHLKE